MRYNSHEMKIIRAVIHTALWWPLYWIVRNYYGYVPIANVIIKFLVYSNTFFMCGGWYQAINIVKGREYTEKDLVKFYLFVILGFVLLEFSWIMQFL